jgi:uncharacterized membrane protein
METSKYSKLTIVLLVAIALFAFLGAIIRIVDSSFGNLFLPPAFGVPGGLFYEIVATLLSIAVVVIYLLGGGVIVFGVMLTVIRFIKAKLQSPLKPAGVAAPLAGYLTLSLELFIGAEIIKTPTTQTFEELETLILIILSRGLFSLILYLERRWCGLDTESE